MLPAATAGTTNMQTASATPGLVVWVTGFSGAGKSTVSSLLQKRFTAAGTASLLLDGDVMRKILAREQGFAPEDRLTLAWTYARLAQEISRQGIVAICATISMFAAVRSWNRQNNAHYLEIYLQVPEAQRAARDSKGVYAGDTAAVRANTTYEEPAEPDLTIENWGGTSAEHAVAAIWKHITRHD
jgi:adenylylsulfate kinase-like enzyme